MAQATARPSSGGAEATRTVPRHADSTAESTQIGFEEVPRRSDVVSSLINFNDLFADVNEHPEGDVRHRFLPERSKRARYVESLVILRAHDVALLENDVLSGKANANDEVFLDEYDVAMERLEQAISRISRVYEEDFRAANAPVVEPHFMNNVHRWFLAQPGKGLRGPNGTLRSTYGSFGDPVPQDFMSLTKGNDDFRRLILEKLMVPFNEHVVPAAEQGLNKIRGRSNATQTPGIGGKKLDVVVTTLECLVPIIFVAASVTLVYNLHSTKDRMIAAPFVCFICTVPIAFLSKDARFIFMLNAGIWAVIIVVVFLSEASSTTKISCDN